jgi:AcrR family transcriptional regulator
MPVLARELGSGVTSIYWYCRSKDELVVALAERVEQQLYARLPRSAG